MLEDLKALIYLLGQVDLQQSGLVLVAILLALAVLVREIKR